MDYKQKVDAFKDSCRMYLHEKAYLASFDCEPMLKRFIQDDISFTESIFDKLEKECGKEARQAVYELFVEEKTQVEVAYGMHISRRKFQYQIGEWLEKVFEETAQEI